MTAKKPTKKTRSSAKVRSSSASKKISFRRRHLFIFALIFALVGGIVIHYSHASPPQDIVLGITHEGPVNLHKDSSGNPHASKQGIEYEILANNTLICGDPTNPDKVKTTALSQAAVDQAVQQVMASGILAAPAVIGAGPGQVMLDNYTGYYLNTASASKSVIVYGGAGQTTFATVMTTLGQQLCAQASKQQSATKIPTPASEQTTTPTTKAAPSTTPVSPGTSPSGISAPPASNKGHSTSAPGKLMTWLGNKLFAKASALSLSWNDFNVQFGDINSARSSRGLNTLSQAACLTAAAQDWAEHEANVGYLTDPPEGTGGTYSTSYCNGNWTTLGDNSGVSPGCNNYSTDNCSQILFNAFMNSAEHKANILLTPANKMGIGAYRDGQGNLWVVHIFANCYTNCGSGTPWQGSGAGTWPSLGGTAIGGPAASSQNSDNMNVFIRTAGNNVAQKYWSSAGSWSGWVGLGGCTTDDPATTAWNGHVAVYIRGCDNAIYRNSWFSGSGWSGWVSLGGCASASPSVASWPGHEEVFVRGCNNYIYHNWTYNSGSTWSGWYGMGGSAAKYGPAAVSWGSGRTDLFYTVSSGAVYHRWYTSTGGWSGEENRGGKFASAPGVYSRYGGNLELWARGTNGLVYHMYFTGSWSGWGNTGEYSYSTPRGTSRASSVEEIFINHSGPTIYHDWWNSTSGWAY